MIQHLWHFLTGAGCTLSINIVHAITVGGTLDLTSLFNVLTTLIGGILAAIILHWLKKIQMR